MAPLREASSVILLRAGNPFEVFLLRRRKGASFMASAFVFPGGAAEADEDARTAAARELFEEAGVLLARDRGDTADTMQVPVVAKLRQRILGGANAAESLAAVGLAWAADSLVPWSHWITPSIEPKRFSARFFVCELPAGQEPSFDDIETVDQAWVTPEDALARSKDLRLPPPQVRTLWELARLGSLAEVHAAARARAEEPHPILPRLRTIEPRRHSAALLAGSESRLAPAAGEPITLLLPWDPDYIEGGSGDSAPLTYRPQWATGPSRFVMEDMTWKHVAAPGSTSAG